MPIDPSIAMGVRPLEVPNPLAQYGQVAQIQAAQRQGEMSQMQLEDLKNDRIEMKNLQAEIAAKGGNPDMGQYAAMLMRTSDPKNHQLGIELSQKWAQQQQADAVLKQLYPELPSLFGAPAGTPATTGAPAPAAAAPVMSMQPGALGSGTFGMAPEPALQRNALAPTTPQVATNQLAMPSSGPQQLSPSGKTRQQLEGLIMAGNSNPYLKGIAETAKLELAEMIKPPIYHNVPGVGLVDPRTGKVITSSVEPTPTDEKMYNLAVSQGFKGSIFDYKKELANAASTKINMPPVAKSLAAPIGAQAQTSLAQAQGALETMTNANSVREALNTDNVIAGPLAGARMKLAQVMDLAGAGDKEKLIASRTAIQGLAAITLDSRSSLKGQGQITDFETGLLERARSGNIADMTMDELHKVVDISQRLAARQYASHETLMGKMRKDPNAQDVVPYYEVGAKLPAPVLTGKPKGVADKEAASVESFFKSRGR